MSLPKIPIQLTGTHDLTIEQVAQAFCHMDAEQMAAFFGHVATISDGWARPVCYMWQFFRDEIDETDNKDALRLLRSLAEYAE